MKQDYDCSMCGNPLCPSSGKEGMRCVGCRGFVEEKKTSTRADRFRSMNDEDLAGWFSEHVGCLVCPMSVECDGRFTMEKLGCKARWYEYLISEE